MDRHDLSQLIIGEWRVDPIAKEISQGDVIAKIDPRNMRVLLLLASRPGALFSQREIEEHAWPGMIVTPESVYQSIAQLRRALSKSDSTRRYIDTVSRRGYRLIAPVDRTPPEQAPLPETQTLALPITIDVVMPLQSDVDNQADTPAAHVNITRVNWRWSKPKQIAALGFAALSVGLISIALTRAFSRPTVDSQRVSRPDNDDVLLQLPTTTSSGIYATTASAKPALPVSDQGDAVVRQSIGILKRSIAKQSHELGERDLALVPSLIVLARFYPWISEPLESEKAARRGLAILRDHKKQTSVEYVRLEAILADAFIDTNRFDEAELTLRKAIALSQTMSGATNNDTSWLTDQLAQLRIAEGRFPEAAVLARNAIADYTNRSDAVTTTTAYLRGTLTWALIEERNYDQAVAEGTIAVQSIKPSDQPSQSSLYGVAIAYHFLGEALLRAGRFDESEKALRTELDLLTKIPHAGSDRARAESALGEVLLNTGRLDSAGLILAKAQQTLAVGDGWRERKSRIETNARIEKLRIAQSHPINVQANLTR